MNYIMQRILAVSKFAGINTAICGFIVNPFSQSIMLSHSQEVHIMFRKVLLSMCIVIMSAAVCCAGDVEVWHDASLKPSELKKIFIMPVDAELKAGNQLMPAKQLNAQLMNWTIDGITSTFKKGRITVKTLDSLLEDMKFIYSDNVTSGDVFYQRASEMGYKAFILVNISQEFKTEHVPETARTYTEYKEIEKRDSKGRIIETIRIPEEKTEIIPAHDVTYLFTDSEPRIYFTADYSGDYVGAVSYKIYREYQGGPVMKVVENIIKASTKILITGKK